MPRADGRTAQQFLARITGLRDFREACSNWDLVAIYREDDEEFEPRCELCHAQIGCAYEIEHQPTSKSIKVGSKCVRRFVLLTGTDTQEDSSRAFERRARQISLREPLRMLALELLNDPIDAARFHQFRRRSAEYFGIRVSELDGRLVGEQWNEFLELVNPSKNPKLTDRVQKALFNPGALRGRVREKKVKKYRHEPWQKKRRAIRTTLARSRTYDNPSRQS